MESREAVIIRNSQRDNLQISWDEEDGFILLFTPNIADTGNHYHVELTEVEATRLSLFVRKKLGELAANHKEVRGNSVE